MSLFGMHPRMRQQIIKARMDFGKRQDYDEMVGLIEGKKVSIESFYNALHPEVYIIPGSCHIMVVEAEWEMSEVVAPIYGLPFSSSRFYVNEDLKSGLFNSFMKTKAFNRLADINQLGFLVPPKNVGSFPDEMINFLMPVFYHKRWEHSLLVAVMIYVLLSRNNFPQEIISAAVLAAASHDIATPAGGDSVKRIDPKNLDEEKNYTFAVKRYGLDKEWKKFGFVLGKAQEWIEGRGLIGRLIDIIDKISYTSLDCCHLADLRIGNVKGFLKKNPLVMNVWEDIRFEGDGIYFADPKRLYDFLVLRALEHTELLYCGYCRTFDYLLFKKVKGLYEKKVVTREDLLDWGDNWLQAVIEKHVGRMDLTLCPEETSCVRFKSEAKAKEFFEKCGRFADHIDHVEKFQTGLDWKVTRGSEIIPLHEVISREKASFLQNLSADIESWYIYYTKTDR